VTNISLAPDHIFWSDTATFDAEWMAYPNERAYSARAIVFTSVM
jgi:hypothetical protein